MRTAYFDCFGGASGDMIVGALLDAGLPLTVLRSALGGLPLQGVTLEDRPATRAGLAGRQFEVIVSDDAPTPHRHLSDILSMLSESGLPPTPAEMAARIFRRLAHAEATVHGIEVEKVHFHEVGAIDSIVDIAGICTALDHLGVQRVECSPIPLGSGAVQTAHGLLPVPTPATAELMRDGVIAPTDAKGELCTPTGAAALTTLADAFGPLPAMRVDAIGYGAGRRNTPDRPNMLRVFLGERDEHGQADTVVELTANIDDASGQILGAVLELLLAAGALDAWAVPIVMKKSRPGTMLCALCEQSRADALERLIFRETTTIGIRRRLCSRSRLPRTSKTVETRFGPIRVKTSLLDGQLCTITPEFDDCVRAAEAHDAPIRAVQQAAMDACAGESSST